MVRLLSARELLGAWEAGATAHPARRALLLLAASSPEMSFDALAELPIGKRDAALYTLRELTFGPQLDAVTVCPNSGDQLELTFAVSDLRASAGTDDVTDAMNERNNSTADLSARVDGYHVRFRLPNSRDLLAIENVSEVNAARVALAERCITDIESSHPPGDELPTEVTDAVAVEMANADPQADVELALTCPHCAHQWQVRFDIGSYFWSEIDAWARRILREVHTIASAYGWGESDILALSPRRRQLYLDMIEG